MKRSVLLTMQKVSILICELNKLGMKNFVEFYEKRYRYGEVQHTL